MREQRRGVVVVVRVMVTNLCPNESLEAGLEVVDAAVVEFGHFVQQLLVLGLEVLPDRSELLSGLTRGRGRGNKRTGHSGHFTHHPLISRHKLQLRLMKHIRPPNCKFVGDERTAAVGKKLEPRLVSFLIVW